jgi:hypothetical protein
MRARPVATSNPGKVISVRIRVDLFPVAMIISAGKKDTPGTIFMIQEKEDELKDMICFLGNTEAGLDSPDGMTVFGFGREEGATPLLKGKQKFIIGLYPDRIENTEGHQKLSEYLQGTFLK